jgi:hypothetical protein
MMIGNLRGEVSKLHQRLSVVDEVAGTRGAARRSVVRGAGSQRAYDLQASGLRARSVVGGLCDRGAGARALTGAPARVAGG